MRQITVIRRKRKKSAGPQRFAHVRLDPKALWSLNELAQARGVSVNILVSEAVDRYIAYMLYEHFSGVDDRTPMQILADASAERVRRERAMGVPRG